MSQEPEEAVRHLLLEEPRQDARVPRSYSQVTVTVTPSSLSVIPTSLAGSLHESFHEEFCPDASCA